MEKFKRTEKKREELNPVFSIIQWICPPVKKFQVNIYTNCLNSRIKGIMNIILETNLFISRGPTTLAKFSTVIFVRSIKIIKHLLMILKATYF